MLLAMRSRNIARTQHPLPPVMEFLLAEFIPRGKGAFGSEEVERRLKDRGFKRDLRDQREATLDDHPYVGLPDDEPKENNGRVYAAGGLSPLSPHLKCTCPRCRFYFVDEFARSLGLYADEVVLADSFSLSLLDITARELFIELLVVARLAPMVRAGVVKFAPAAYGRCKACAKETKRAQRRAERVLWNELLRSVDVFAFRWTRGYRLSFGSPHFPQGVNGMRFTVPISAAALKHFPVGKTLTGVKARSWLQKYRKLIFPELEHFANSLTFELAMSCFSSAVIATNNDFAMAGLQAADRAPFLRTHVERESLPEVALPYLTGLSTVQVLEVREKAHKALPAFRARLQRDLIVEEGGLTPSHRKVAKALQMEVAELEAELASLHLSGTRRRERLLAVLGCVMTVMGFGSGRSDLAFAGGASLAGVLSALHTGTAERERRHAAIQGHPAFVLLTAKEVRHHSAADFA